jgi:hypothetical protein
LLAYVVSVLHIAALHRCVAAHCDPCAPCVVPESYCLGQPQLCGRRTVFMSVFISVRHTSAKPFPRWTVAFVASSINRNSGQLTAVISKVGRCVSGHDESGSQSRIVRLGRIGSDRRAVGRSELGLDRMIGSERNFVTTAFNNGTMG